MFKAGILTDIPSGVAQLAERRTVNPQVVGSSPTPGAKSLLKKRRLLLVLFPILAIWWVGSIRACSSVVRAGDS